MKALQILTVVIYVVTIIMLAYLQLISLYVATVILIVSSPCLKQIMNEKLASSSENDTTFMMHSMIFMFGFPMITYRSKALTDTLKDTRTSSL